MDLDVRRSNGGLVEANWTTTSSATYIIYSFRMRNAQCELIMVAENDAIQSSGSVRVQIPVEHLCRSLTVTVTPSVPSEDLMDAEDGVETFSFKSEKSIRVSTLDVEHSLESHMSMMNVLTNQVIELPSREIEPLTVTVERPSCRAVTVVITCDESPHHWLISIKPARDKKNKKICFVDGNVRRFALPASHVKTGRVCTVSVKGLVTMDDDDEDDGDDGEDGEDGDGSDRCYSVCKNGFCSFYNDFTPSDIRRLHRIAVQHTNTGQKTSVCKWFYRNKSPEYFSDIFENHNGVMEKYVKDRSGDPASPINARLDGLFFLASVESNGQPLRKSQFGSMRLLAPADVLLELTGNFYFADFYCMRGKFHYVTIVMTKPDSPADVFCSENNLLRIDILENPDNPFLFRRSGNLFVSTRDHLMVELFYTEDIDVRGVIARHGAQIQVDIPAIGKQSSTPGGVPKNSRCKICNL